MSKFAVSTSTHPLATQAIGEVLGGLLDGGVDFEPSLVFLAVSSHHIGALEDIADAVRQVLGPEILIGHAGSDVIAGANEIENAPCITALGGQADGLIPVRLDTARSDEGVRITGLDATEFAAAHSLLLLAEPGSTPLEGLTRHIADRHGHLTVVGAASSPTRPARFLLQSDLHARGAIGLLFAGATRLESVSASGCRAVGTPLTVTRSNRGSISQVAGQPVLEYLQRLLAELQAEDPAVAESHMRIGLLDQQGADPRSRPTIRSFSVHQETGLTVGANVSVGRVVQFQLMDPAEAALNLQAQSLGHEPDAALLFSSMQRGAEFFGSHDHDAAMLAETFHGTPIAGFRSALEISQLTGLVAPHQGTATAALLTSGRAESS
jgi:small ligand-binding sensory domain FIST